MTPSIPGLRHQLLTWYAEHRRDLPWRKTKNPYFIWISEVMLQQTRVDTVIPYYRDFVERFPTVQDLARASQESVLKSWQGLGYYRRAKHLHEAAKELVAAYAGRLPKTKKELSALKGFGAYTSASVASIAFGEPVACVDGNVRRVVSRIFATHEGIDPLAQELLEPRDPSSFNQAMMELGALICLPKNPRCEDCPIRPNCVAHHQKSVDQFPALKVKAKPKDVFAYVFVPEFKGLYYVEPCAPGGRFEGLWQFPTLEYEKAQNPSSLRKDLQRSYKLRWDDPEPLATFKHLLTHRSYRVWSGRITLKKKATFPSGKWLSAKKVVEKPFSKLQQKILERVLKAPT